MKKIYYLAIVSLFLLVPYISFAGNDLSKRLSGRILLQVENSGEAWYVEPTTQERAFLGRPDDAFRIMRELGLGIAEKDFNSFREKAPQRLSGRILLRVEANGEAYYVNPVDLKMHFLGRPSDAFEVMRNLGLGISNADINKVKTFEKYNEKSGLSDNSYIKTPNLDKDLLIINSDKEVNSIIKAINNLIITLQENIKDGDLVIRATKDKMDMFLDYYLVQSSGQQLINEMNSYNFLRSETINLLKKMKEECSSLLGTGNQTSEKLKKYETQLDNYLNQKKVVSEKVDRLIVYNAEELGKASSDSVNKSKEELLKLEKAVEASKILNQNISTIDSKLSLLLASLDNKADEIEAIKKQAISASSMTIKLNKAYSEYDAIVFEYNDLLSLRDELIMLFGVLDDYVKKNIPISTKNSQLFNLWGINL